jgi:hypothetical protein
MDRRVKPGNDRNLALSGVAMSLLFLTEGARQLIQEGLDQE